MRVLFVCTGNTCRSPLAERLGRLNYPGVTWESAGVMPTGSIHPLSARVLHERRGDPTGFQGRHVDDLELADYDHLVLIGETAKGYVTDVPGPTRTHYWDVADPFEVSGTEDEVLTAYRHCADELTERLTGFMAAITTG